LLQVCGFLGVLVEFKPGHEVALDVGESGEELGVGLGEIFLCLKFF
jgi:hypothetical protein